MIDDETLARFTKQMKNDDTLDGPYRQMAVNILWSLREIDADGLPELDDGEADDILSDLPAELDSF